MWLCYPFDGLVPHVLDSNSIIEMCAISELVHTMGMCNGHVHAMQHIAGKSEDISVTYCLL